MPKKSPAKPKAPDVPKAKKKTAAPSDLAEKFLGITAANILAETPVPTRQPNDPFPASVFPSEEAMSQSLGVRPDLVGGTFKSQLTPENQSIAPFPTESKQTRQADSTDGQNPVETDAAGSGQAGLDAVTTQVTADDRQKNQGDVPLLVADSLDIYQKGVLTRVESQADATRRWRNEGIGERVAAFRDRVRGEYTAANPGCKRRDAHEHAWARAMAAFPPAGVIPEPETVRPTVGQTDEPPVAPAPIQDDQGVSGLSDLPPGWPELPANAQLQVEIAWVTANRLRVRCGTGVDLSRALSPAPSYSALSWLETSILFPAKFADISVKATADNDSEKEFIKREKLAIEEIRSILAEMMEAEAG